MEAKTIIQRFDIIDKKGFDESDIQIALNEIPVSERQLFVNLAEWIAFAFSEGRENDWNTYYGPLFVRNDGICIPSKDSITKEILDYWKARIDEVVNPLIKARYCGLLVDFMPQCGVEIRKLYLHSLLETVKGNYPKYAINSVNKLRRAFQIAITSKNTEDISSVKKAIDTYDAKYAKDNNVGIWGRAFLIMFDNIDSFTEEEHLLFVNRVEDRITRLFEKPIDGAGEERFNAFAISEAVELLAKYYHKKHDNDNIKRVLRVMFDAFHKEFPKLSGLQKFGVLDRLYKIYTHYHLYVEAEAILKELQVASQSVSDEMSKIEIPFSISKEEMESYVDSMTTGSFDDVLGAFIFQYIPNKQERQTELLEISKTAPLMALCPTSIFDYKGRPSSFIGSIESDLEGNLVHHIAQSFNISHLFMRGVLDRLIQKGLFCKKTILDFLSQCPFFETDRFSIIERGIFAYFDDDYLVAMHLLIPQIENAIRNIIELSGGSTIKSQKGNKGFQLKTFDELLRDSDFVFEKDLSYYFRVLFTDQRGWNLRNSICHGIAPITSYNQMTVDRVFHALMCIGAIRLVEPSR